ncbi:catalase family peroxidase [Mycolicibacterium stellerae]|uniref:catalase family peroxidase n=1 Tax=Mycolicibacterium stellerae TaxID=2358193 RepID=UPI000F0BC04A|nr:catalase family peroxidase [Mycolicibacterium stellerae]
MDREPPGAKWLGAPVTRRSVLAGVGAVAAFLAVDLGAVAYANNWIAPRTLSRQTFIDGFQTVFGRHPGFRRNHAKGMAVTGLFDSNGNGAELSSAAVFAAGRTSVTGRFSLTGGDPSVADTPSAARGLALAFGFPGPDQWRSANLSLPVFPDSSPQGFYDRLLASKIVAATGKPDPDAMARFNTAHPETVAAMAIIKKTPPTSGFADSTFSSLNTFFFVNDAGTRTPVRWAFVPQQSALPPKPAGDNALFNSVVRQLRTGPLRWKLHLTVGQPSDPVDDATQPWPSDRRVIDAGTLSLIAAQTEAPGNARDVNFDPLVLPDGIEPSGDPLLSARSSVYAASYRLRSGETASPSAVQVDEVTP